MFCLRPHKLRIKKTSGGGWDNGNPVQVDSQWSEEIACHFSTESRQTILRYEDGSFTKFDYAVWLDTIDEDLTGKYVCLIDQYGNIREKERIVHKCINRQLRTKLYL